MADDTTLDLSIRTKADTAGINATADALSKAEAKARDLGAASTVAGDAMESAMESAKAKIQAAEQSINAAKSSAADNGKMAQIGAVVDVGNTVVNAAKAGWEIGKALREPLERVLQDGFSISNLLGLDEGAQETAAQTRAAFNDIAAAHAELVEKLNSPPDNAGDWLRELAQASDFASAALERLQRIQKAQDSAAAKLEDAKHKANVEGIEGGGGTDADKARAMAEETARHEAEKLKQREAARAGTVNQAKQEAQRAQSDRLEKEGVLFEQDKRARLAIEADLAGKERAAHYSDAPEWARKEQEEEGRRIFLKERGANPDAIGSAKDEMQAREKAAQAVAAARIQEKKKSDAIAGVEAVAGIEGAADKQATASGVNVSRAQAERRAAGFDERDKASVAREQDKQAREKERAREKAEQGLNRDAAGIGSNLASVSKGGNANATALQAAAAKLKDGTNAEEVSGVLEAINQLGPALAGRDEAAKAEFRSIRAALQQLQAQFKNQR